MVLDAKSVASFIAILKAIMRFLRKPFQLIRGDLRAYLVFNAISYGFVIAGFVAAMIFPDLVQATIADLETSGASDTVRSLLTSPWLFAPVIFAVNVFSVGLPWILLPSLLVPFAGIALFAYKAFMLGSGLAPTSDIVAVGLIPHSVTAIIEFQAYALLMFGVYLLGKSWLRPKTVGAKNHRWGYFHGLQKLGWVSLLALVLFIVGAIYEAFSLLYFIGPLAKWLL